LIILPIEDMYLVVPVGSAQAAMTTRVGVDNRVAG
jgi:hypothetical protein